MKWTRGALMAGFLLYVFLWVLFFAGASAFLPLLVIPPVLVVLVGGGNFLDQFLGIKHRAPKFRDRDDEQ